MIYDYSNTDADCWVVLVGTGRIKRCASVDTKNATATFYEEPLIVIDEERFKMFTGQFSAIHPVFAGSPLPCMILIFP